MIHFYISATEVVWQQAQVAYHCELSKLLCMTGIRACAGVKASPDVIMLQP